MAQVSIEVNGRPYVVGCEDGQERRLRDLAAAFDSQVRQVAREVGLLGETRLMLMGALVMADEMTELRAELALARAELTEAKSLMSRGELKAVAALEAAAQKIETLAAE
ncbi:MAG: cell division protein ZapA [Caulobacterales bacterium]